METNLLQPRAYALFGIAHPKFREELEKGRQRDGARLDGFRAPAGGRSAVVAQATGRK